MPRLQVLEYYIIHSLFIGGRQHGLAAAQQVAEKPDFSYIRINASLL